MSSGTKGWGVGGAEASWVDFQPKESWAEGGED